MAAIKPVDLVDNARFHAHAVELDYATLLRHRQQQEANDPATDPAKVAAAEVEP